MANSDIWMPFFVGDYLADTRRLSTEQHGAYLLLIFDYWKSGPPPDDDAILAQTTGLTPRAWKANKRAIQRFFSVVNGEWRHKRIDAERAKAETNREKYSRRASKAAHARWDATSNAKSIPSSNNTSMLGSCTSTPTSEIVSNETIIQPNGCSSAEPPLTMAEIVEAWNERMVPQGFPAVKRITGTRKRHLAARLKENTVEDFEKAMTALERSAFCRGDSKSGWRADFDFFVQAKSFTKLLEGAYDH